MVNEALEKELARAQKHFGMYRIDELKKQLEDEEHMARRVSEINPDSALVEEARDRAYLIRLLFWKWGIRF